ncbi:3',5'-cyclic-AMP phosphodiesterase [Reinekea thalattae]|uniref:3',5'-cyclic-AMP phosphodiesterase n=1 Tax=Reinekea thalattae TaxID=2593301 RepID=A0A5C8Z2E1_9GAMM|nr:3',5'-cyclic-AMP phosphodiesterase [Reinekea thalattae]TXR51418.1 3',5'-cyclic-AMP phosphodiesterase [Reinekea thalattae]
MAVMMEQSYTLLQITDPHLHASKEGTLLGMNTYDSLQQVIGQVQLCGSNIDLLLATGDISQDGSQQAYQHFLNSVSAIDAPMYWIPGNHDCPRGMSHSSKGFNHEQSVLELGSWLIVLLDTHVCDEVHGELSHTELDRLERALEQHPNHHVLISCHHHPINIGSAWMDKIGIHNGDKLQAIIRCHNNVRCVLFGHVHQQSDRTLNGVRYLSTPSTCVQFLPNSDEFATDSQPPGFRVLKLKANGQIETRVSRVSHFKVELDETLTAY